MEKTSARPGKLHRIAGIEKETPWASLFLTALNLYFIRGM
jgi:hypothetical protein